MRCPTCNTVYCDTVVSNEIAGRVINCPVCGPQFWRAFLPGHPSHPDYQPLRIEHPRDQAPAAKAKRAKQATRQRGQQLQRERAATT